MSVLEKLKLNPRYELNISSSSMNMVEDALIEAYDLIENGGGGGGGAVDSVNGKVGVVVLDKADIGLSNTDNTSDLNKPVSTATQAALNDKVDKIAGLGLSENNYTTTEKNKLAGIDMSTKVDKEAGKGLSTNDYTTAEKTKLSNFHNYIEMLDFFEGTATDLNLYGVLMNADTGVSDNLILDIPLVTTTKVGAMIPADKLKLDRITTYNTNLGISQLPGKIEIAWGNYNPSTGTGLMDIFDINPTTDLVAGLFLPEEKRKLINLGRSFEKVYYVDPTNSADTYQTGSTDHPYSGTAELFAQHGTETGVLVYLRNSDALDIIANNLTDWTFSGFLATKDAGRTNVNSISVEGTSTGCYFIGLVVNTSYHDTSSVGNNYARYITVKQGTTIVSAGYSCFELSSAMGNVVVNSGNFDFLNSALETTASMTVNGGSVIITSGRRVTLQQTSGTVISMGATMFTPASSGSYAIQQTGGILLLFSGDAVKTDGTPAPISLHGGVFSLGTLSYDAPNSTIDGGEVFNGLQARQVFDTQTFTNITPSNRRQSSINTAIDALLGTISQKADDALAAASSSKHFKGQLQYGADTVATMNTITGMVSGDLCGVDATQLTYTYDGTAWNANPQSGDAIGDQYDIVRWYGTYHGATYTGNATATITCDNDTPGSIHYVLNVSESTPVDQDTIQTVNGVNKVGDRLVSTSADGTPFINGQLSFASFFSQTINKINTLITNLGTKQNIIPKGTTGNIVTYGAVNGSFEEMDVTSVALKNVDFRTNITNTNKGITDAEFDNAVKKINLTNQSIASNAVLDLLMNTQAINGAEAALTLSDANYVIVNNHTTSSAATVIDGGSLTETLPFIELYSSYEIKCYNFGYGIGSFFASDNSIAFIAHSNIDSLVVQDGSTVTLGTDGVATNVTLSNGGILIINDDANVTGTIFNNGGIVIDARTTGGVDLSTYIRKPIIINTTSQYNGLASGQLYFDNRGTGTGDLILKLKA
ncbi:hypothetical protein AGMMS50239_36660 [Bacteroidia bacterium]|nr:hypothetical protein AGMMS50239_36660 [Bacteroidia bacterium]